MANALLVHLKRRSKSWIEIYNFKDVKPDVKEELIKASKAAARERESKSQQRHTPLSVANSNNASSGSKRSQSPAVSTGTSTPVPLTNISRRDSRTALDNKQSGNLPASLPKIPSGPRRADDGPPSRSTSISQPESRRQPIQINGIAESSRGGHNRDNSGRYGRRGGNDTPSEAPLRQSLRQSLKEVVEAADPVIVMKKPEPTVVELHQTSAGMVDQGLNAVDMLHLIVAIILLNCDVVVTVKLI